MDFQLATFLRIRGICAAFRTSRPAFLSGCLSCPVGGWIVRPPTPTPPAPQVPPTHRLITISQPTFEQTESTTGARRSPAPGSSSPTFPGSSRFSVGLKMSVAVAESCFLSALQPNTSCTAYLVPSDGPSPDPVAKARRVQEQVRMRLAEKKSCSLGRLDDSVAGSPGEPPYSISVPPSGSLDVGSLDIYARLRRLNSWKLMKNNFSRQQSKNIFYHRNNKTGQSHLHSAFFCICSALDLIN